MHSPSKDLLSNVWKRLFGETRTRILLIYVITMLGVTLLAIPIFRSILFSKIDARVREDLEEEIEEFQGEYDAWAMTNDLTDNDLTTFIDTFIRESRPEDDNIHIFILDDEFYRANPPSVPEELTPDSDLVASWLTLAEFESAAETGDGDSVVINRGEHVSDELGVGTILYKVLALNIGGQRKGMFVATHLTYGERAEALIIVYIFAWIALGVVVLSFFLAWAGSYQLFAPVRSLAKTAHAISESNLSERLDFRGHGELADLASTFNAMMGRLQTSFESQRNFINDASHELRTPITIIQGHLELMGDDPIEKEETVELVMDELDRMGRFVNDLILLAKSEHPDFLQLETIDIPAFVEEIFHKACAVAPRKWQSKTCEAGKMVGDRQRLTGALLNLAQNATQFTQETDTIEIGSAIDDAEVRLWVKDTGEGISDVDQSRIFDRFARASSSYRRSEGAGLGLAIVKAIAEAHGGHIQLTSNVGLGSTFTLVLPLEPIQEKQTV